MTLSIPQHIDQLSPLVGDYAEKARPGAGLGNLVSRIALRGKKGDSQGKAGGKHQRDA